MFLNLAFTWAEKKGKGRPRSETHRGGYPFLDEIASNRNETVPHRVKPSGSEGYCGPAY